MTILTRPSTDRTQMDVQEAAVVLNVHPLTVHKWIRKGGLRSTKGANGKRYVTMQAVAQFLMGRLRDPNTREETLAWLADRAALAGVAFDPERAAHDLLKMTGTEATPATDPFAVRA